MIWMAKHLKDFTYFVGGGILYFGDTLGIFMLGMLEVLIFSIDNSNDGSYGNLHNCFPK